MDIYAAANTLKFERKTIFDLQIRVTFYARVSSTTDEQENSIENQIEHFQEMIQGCENWTYVEGYVDRVRGEGATNRTSFLQMVEDGKAGKFDLVLTKEVSRFARNTIDSLTYTRELLRAGVGVLFQNDNICTIDTDSELRLTIMSSIAADEVRKLSERVKFGHQRSIQNGKVLGNNRIFGYDKVDCKLTINEAEAEMVRLIFNLYVTGEYSTRKIERILYDKGYRGRNGTRIHHNTITNIIQNPKYKGYYCGNKVKIVDHRTKEQKFLPAEEWVTYKDETGETVPALVSEEIWDKCNDIFKERSTAIKTRERSFKDTSVFTGKIWCSAHQRPYWRTSYSNSASRGKPIYQWICSEKKRVNAKSCASFAILESDLYEILSQYLQNIIPNLDDYITTFLRLYQEADESDSTKKQLATMRSQLQREIAKREKLLDAYTDDLISKTEFKERNGNLSVLITMLEEEITTLETQRSADAEYAKELKHIDEYLKTMYDPNSPMTTEVIDEIANAVIERIDVTPVNNTAMRLEIALKTGVNHDCSYVRKGGRYGRRSGHTFKKISPEQQWNYARANRRKTGHCQSFTYLTCLVV